MSSFHLHTWKLSLLSEANLLEISVFLLLAHSSIQDHIYTNLEGIIAALFKILGDQNSVELPSIVLGILIIFIIIHVTYLEIVYNREYRIIYYMLILF